MKIATIAVSILLLCACAKDTTAPGNRDGQVSIQADERFLAWNAVEQQWLTPDDFWQQFSERRRGTLWPSSRIFPQYADVNEHDTILIQTDSGPCLMYFFHSRWRRANDVWRWGDEFNRYGGCPDVFNR